jgi:DNA-binding transcriptional MocR family regulator
MRARQKLAADRLSSFEIQTNKKSYHLWLTLPAHWRSQTFVAAAARRDIALTPSTTFAATPGHAPNAVRFRWRPRRWISSILACAHWPRC